MTVIVANDTPDAIRGMLKRWFIEPKPNVFIGTLNPRTHSKVVSYIMRNTSEEFGMLVISSARNCQGYIIDRHGAIGIFGREEIDVSGISLVLEKSGDAQPSEEEIAEWPF